MTDETTEDPNVLRNLVTRAHVVLWDFDGPICRLFAGHKAEQVAKELVEWLERQGLSGLLTEKEREHPDPQVVLRAVDRRHPDSDLVAELEERLTREELRAVSSAMPTPYADPVIRTWAALGSRFAVVTNNSAHAVRNYLDGRRLLSSFAPHVYGRTNRLDLLKPHPHCLVHALNTMGAAPSDALMIGDSPGDCQAAAEAGVHFLGYATSDRKHAELRAAGADVVGRSLKSVLDVLWSARPGR